MKSGITTIDSALADIYIKGMKATRIVISRNFFEEELRPLLVFENNTAAGIGILFGIPVEITDDPLAPNWAIDYEEPGWRFIANEVLKNYRWPPIVTTGL